MEIWPPSNGLVIPIISIIVGIVIIAFPRVIAYVIGIYLVIVGVLCLIAAI